LLPVGLELIDNTARIHETRLFARFEALKPQLFGALLDEVSAVLRDLPNIHLDELPRMADFARLLAALPMPPGTPSEAMPVSIYLRLFERLKLEIAEDDPVAAALSEFMSTRDSWQGTATELLSLLVRPEESRGWPKTAQPLAGRLKRLAPALKTMGILVNQTRATDYARTRQIQLKSTPVDLSVKAGCPELVEG